MSRRLAFAGQNPNTPIRMYDTHPNRRFAVGEEVVPVDPADVPMTGQVLGHCAEDRLWIRWGHGLITQEDTDDLIAKREYSVTSSIVNEVSYDSSKQDDVSRQAKRSVQAMHSEADIQKILAEYNQLAQRMMKNPKAATPKDYDRLEYLGSLLKTPGGSSSGAGMLDSFGTDNFGSNGRNSSKGSDVITRSEAYVGLRGAASLAAQAGYRNESRVIGNARRVAEALEVSFGTRPQRIARSVEASNALVNATESLNSAVKTLLASKDATAIQAGLAAERFFTASVAYDPLREDNHDDDKKIVEDAIKEGESIVPFKTNTTKES